MIPPRSRSLRFIGPLRWYCRLRGDGNPVVGEESEAIVVVTAGSQGRHIDDFPACSSERLRSTCHKSGEFSLAFKFNHLE
jgi:hypothetical protein